MFKVGEVVFCPMRGTGKVEAIEMRTMLNESKEYVIIQMKEPSMTMMVPTDKIDKSGFRKLNDKQEAEKVETILAEDDVEVTYKVDNKTRTKKNHDKLSSGSFLQCGEVVRDLSCMEHIKALSSMEKTMLLQAKRLLLAEYAIIKQVTEKEAEGIVDRLLEARMAD